MLLRVGVYMMAFALALTALAVAYTVAFREEPERAVAEPVASEATVKPLVREYPPAPEPEVKHTEQRPAPQEAEPMFPVPAPMRTPPRGKTEVLGMKVAAAMTASYCPRSVCGRISASVLRWGW